MDEFPPATVTVEAERFYVRSHFCWQQTCRALPGARWEPGSTVEPLRPGRWHCPASKIHAAAILESFGEEGLDLSSLALIHEWVGGGDAAEQTADLPPVPFTKTEPWPHQQRAYWFARRLWEKGRPGVMLALGMGCGKSKVTIDLISSLGLRRVLIFCPKSVCEAWPRQFAAHASAAIHVEELGSGSMVKRRDRAADVCADQQRAVAVVTNYEAVSCSSKDFADWIEKQHWDLLVCDEVHCIKEPMGVRSRFIAKLAEKSPRRLGLTGTPLPHSPLDVFAEYRFLDRSIFGPHLGAFKFRYCIADAVFPSKIVGWRNKSELKQRIAEIMIQARPDDVLKLPPAVHMERVIALDESRAAYVSMEKDFLVWLRDGHEVTAANAMVKIGRLQEITSGHIDGERIGSEKKRALVDALAELSPVEPVVVFCRFHSDLDQVHEVAEELGRASLELSGRGTRGRGLTAWQEGDAPILACQIRAGSLGVDMTRARYGIYFSLSFSLSEYEQSLARLRRPGQRGDSVVYIHIVARGTVDVKVYAALRNRKEVVDSFLGKEEDGSKAVRDALTDSAGHD